VVVGSQQLDYTRHLLRGGEKLASEADDYVAARLCTAGLADACKTPVAE